MDSVDEAFDKGFAAFEEDTPIRRNPYNPSHSEAESDAWENGWFEARANAFHASGHSYEDDF